MLDNPFQPPYQVLLQIYTHHSLREHFEDYWRTLTKLQTAQPLTQRSITEAHYLAEARVEFLGLYNTTEAAKAMHKVDDTLHSLLITNVLRYSFTIEIIGQQMDETFANPLLQPILAYINTHRKWAKTYPMLYVYYVLYLQIKALQNNTADKRWLAAWLAQVQKHETIFDTAELQKFYMAAENIAALIINKNTRDQTAYTLLLSIYTAQRELGFFLKVDKSIDAGKFINYINVALKSKQTAKAANFIENTTTSLFIKTKNDTFTPTERLAFMENHDIVRYAWALVFFQQKRFEEVITNLRFRHFDDENFRLRSEIVFVKAGYEREEAAHHRKGRHTKHGTRQSVSDFVKLITTSQTTTPDLAAKYELFAAVLLKMIAITDESRRNCTSETTKNAFKNEIETLPVLLERDWFLEKCAQL
jgi:hypothetical protein